MNAAQMITAKLKQMEGAKGNYLDSSLARDNKLFLKLIADELRYEADERERANHRLARDFARANLFRVMQESTNGRINNTDEAEQIRVMNNDHNLTTHSQYDEWEPI